MKLWAAAATLMVAAAAAASACRDDAHCDVGYFCSVVLNECQACLRCADYSRRDADGCVKAADDCLDCLPGYESSRVTHECVDAAAAAEAEAAAAADADRALPYYVWVPMLIGTLLVLIALAVVCASRLKRSKLFRPASYAAPGDAEAPRCASPQQPPPVESSAPPPPYNDAVNNNYPAASPYAPPDRNGRKPDDAGDADIFVSEGAPRPKFVERSDSVLVHGHRETETGQEARVYNTPHYITPAQLPPSYDDALSEPSDSNGPPEDEETLASTWTQDTEPAHSTEEQSLSALLSEARGRELVRQPERDSTEPAGPAAKLLCVRPQERPRAVGDATDAPSTSSGPHPHPHPSATGSGADGTAPAPSASAAAANSNVTFTINFQQLNDVKLLRL